MDVRSANALAWSPRNVSECIGTITSPPSVALITKKRTDALRQCRARFLSVLLPDVLAALASASAARY
jgi:hypothetical protein